MEIGNYLSKNYNGSNENNEKYTLNINNQNLSNANIFLNTNRKKAKEKRDNNNNSNSSSSRINIKNYYKEKNALSGRNNNSLYERDITNTVNAKNKPIKLMIGGNIENQKKKIKKLNLKYINNNFTTSNKDGISTKKFDLSPLKISKRNIFKIKDNETNKIINERYLLNNLDYKNDDVVVNNKKEYKNEENNSKTNDIEKNNNTIKKKKPEVIKEFRSDNDLIKPKIEDDQSPKLKNSSIIKTLTSSEKKLILHPPTGIKNNSYGKMVLNRKKSIFETIQ
jgi:hypothetical protein